jgi:hypothetical protein
VIVFHEPDHRREQWVHGGWNLADDDVPHRPEPDPMSSAQARRYWQQLPPTSCTQCEAHGW